MATLGAGVAAVLERARGCAGEKGKFGAGLWVRRGSGSQMVATESVAVRVGDEIKEIEKNKKWHVVELEGRSCELGG